MNKIAASVLFVSLGLAGCDDEPTFRVVEEPAGANCPTGGFRIEADKEIFYSCDEQATTVPVAAGAEGNPCPGAALLITIPSSDGTVRTSYVCEKPADANPEVLQALIGQYSLSIASMRVECECTTDEESAATCASEIATAERLIPVVNSCARDVLALASPLQESDRAMLECVGEGFVEVETCFNSIPTAECSEETEAQLDACLGVAESQLESCPEASDSLNRWTAEVGQLAGFLRCPLFGMN